MREELLRNIVDPAHTALITTGVQRSNVGDQSSVPLLAQRFQEAGTVTKMAQVCNGARAVGVRVLHTIIENRPDGAGQVINTRIQAHAERVRGGGRATLVQDTEGAMLPPELGPDPRDIVVPRLHGLTPFPSTALNQILRNLGVTTFVATGVSVNINVMGLVLVGADLGYQVVVVRDAVAGAPAEYVQGVMDNTFALVATIVTADELMGLWNVPDAVMVS